MSTIKTDQLGNITGTIVTDLDNIFDVSNNTTDTFGTGDLHLTNKAIITSDSNGWDSDRTGTNIDHIWHDDTNNRWNFCSDTTYKASGNSTLRVKEVLPEDVSWTTPTLTNSWVDYGSIFEPAAYYKDASGTVFIQGLIKSGTAGTIFTLPEGYRPNQTLLFATDKYHYDNNALARIDITAAGVVYGNTIHATFTSIVMSFKASL